MTSQTQIDYAIRYGKHLRKFVREINLPKYKRVRVGGALRYSAITCLNDFLSELKLLKKHLEEQ